ncbi:MAG: hypothetical protein KBT68_03095 [bacterium]|nr:hypothetical protein [Candidatus Colisoma equi]
MQILTDNPTIHTTQTAIERELAYQSKKSTPLELDAVPSADCQKSIRMPTDQNRKAVSPQGATIPTRPIDKTMIRHNQEHEEASEHLHIPVSRFSLTVTRHGTDQ